MDEPILIMAAGRQIDLRNALPIKFGDVRAIQKMGMSEGDLESVGKMVAYWLTKATGCDPEITAEDVDDMDIAEVLKVRTLMDEFGNAGLEGVPEAERPT